MDYEKKLALAKEALDSGSYDKETIEYIFPELIESEDERVRKELLSFFTERAKYTEDSTFNGLSSKGIISWLEKQGEQKPQGKTALEAINEEKVDNANKVEPRQEKLTKFEKAVKQVMEEAIECGDTHNLKVDAEMLLSLVHKPAWSEEDEKIMNTTLCIISDFKNVYENSKEAQKDADKIEDWLKSLKDRVQPKQEWSEEDERLREYCINAINGIHYYSPENKQELVGWLKSLRPQKQWKPSDEQMRTLEHYMHTLVCNEHKEVLFGLYSDLKELRGE